MEHNKIAAVVSTSYPCQTRKTLPGVSASQDKKTETTAIKNINTNILNII